MPKIVSVVIILFWLTMTGWFIQREIWPALPTLNQPSYQTLLTNRTIPRQSRMGIYFLHHKIGYSLTSIGSLPSGSFQITNYTQFDPSLMPLMPADLPAGMKRPFVFTSSSVISPDYSLYSLKISLTSPLGDYELLGTREGDQLVLTIRDKATTRTERISFPKGVTVSDGLSPFVAMPNLSVGKEWMISLINPFSLSWETVKAYVEEKTTLEWAGKTYEVYEVTVDYKGFKPRAWITPEGIILKQEVLTSGLYLIREE